MNLIGLANLIFCVIMLVRCAVRRELTAVYWAAALVLGGLPLAVPSLVNFENHPGYVFTDSVVSGCALFVLGFNILLGATAHLMTSHKKSRGLPVQCDEFSPSQLVIIRKSFPWLCVAFVFCAPLLVWMTAGSLFSIGSYKWTDSAAMYEGKSQYALVAVNTWFMVFSVAAPLALLLNRYLIVALLLVVAFATTQVLGSRTFLLPCLLPIVTILILRLLTVRQGSTPLHFAGRLIVSAAVLVIAYDGMTFVTWSRSRFDVASLTTNIGAAWAEFADTHEARLDASSGAMLYTFAMFPSALPYCNGLTYVEIALTPIPGFVLRGLGLSEMKTNRFTGNILAGDLYGTDYTSRFGSIHPTLWGDAYANFGPMGALLGIFWGLVFGGIERRLRGSQILSVIALPSYASFIGVLVRGSMLHATFYFYNASLLVCLLALLVYLFKPSAFQLAITPAPGGLRRSLPGLHPSLSNAPNH